MGKSPDQNIDRFSSFSAADKTAPDPLVRVMALHALAYCERLFYLEEVEEIRVADANVYDGRRLHQELEKEDEAFTLELASESLGLRGKLDAVKRQTGGWQVVEHKKGRSQKGQPWPSDRLQVLAYALLLSEHLGQEVKEAVIRYHADNQKVVIPLDHTAALMEVQKAVVRARQLRMDMERPPVTVQEKLCRTCSLAPVCLPEEERFALGDATKPQRLFPPDEDRRIVHLVEQGSAIRREGEQFMVSRPDAPTKALPGHGVAALVLHGNVQISTQALHFCAAHDIGVHWLSYGGHYVGGFTIGVGGVQRRNRQYRAVQVPGLRLGLARRLVLAKVDNQLRYLWRSLRGRPDLDDLPGVKAGLEQLRGFVRDLNRPFEAEPSRPIDFSSPDPTVCLTPQVQEALEKVRGLEGQAGRIYFGILPHLLKLPPDSFLTFPGRTRRPPRDAFNALLSFGYALLQKDCVASLLAVGLEPALGLLHTPRSAAHPLALDLMDLFRLILWDIPLIGSVNRRQWSLEHFMVSPGHVWLNPDGRRQAIQLYESRKQEKWKHPVLDYSLSYARTLELEARLLEKEWTGRPGLFAQMRLR